MFDLASSSVAFDSVPPPSAVRPAAPPTGYPIELELLESAIRAGRTSLRQGLLEAYRLGRTKPRALTSPQEALLRAIGESATPGDLAQAWGAARRIPVGFRPRVLARTLGAVMKLGLATVADGVVVLTAAGLVALQAG